MTDKVTVKLKVPWLDGCSRLLCVDDRYAAKPFRDRDSQHIEWCGGDVIVVKDFFDECNKVPDVSRYEIKDRHHDRKYRICDDRYIVRHCDKRQVTKGPNIVLIVESPHKREYEGENVAKPRYPACGKTGNGIDRSLGSVLMHIQEEKGLIELGQDVVISNPIQFQTSLHAVHGQALSKKQWKRLRDNVWKTLWREQAIQHCFQERICRYNPSLIINACTNELKGEVRTCVQSWFSERQPQVPLYEVAHPSSWTDLRPKRVS